MFEGHGSVFDGEFGFGVTNGQDGNQGYGDVGQ